MESRSLSRQCRAPEEVVPEVEQVTVAKGYLDLDSFSSRPRATRGKFAILFVRDNCTVLIKRERTKKKKKVVIVKEREYR